MEDFSDTYIRLKQRIKKANKQEKKQTAQIQLIVINHICFFWLVMQSDLQKEAGANGE